MNAVLIFGASGHGKVLADIASACGIFVVGFVDNAKPEGTIVNGIQVLGSEQDLELIVKKTGCSSGIVAIGDNSIRGQVVQKILDRVPHFAFISLIHPKSILATNVTVGEGSVIMAGAVVNPDVRIGAHCIVNTQSSIDHDCVLADFASIAPGATLGGAVRVGNASSIGLGANIIHGRTIGEHTVVGAGSLVLEDIGDLLVAYGVPAKVIRMRIRGEKYL